MLLSAIREKSLEQIDNCTSVASNLACLRMQLFQNCTKKHDDSYETGRTAAKK